MHKHCLTLSAFGFVALAVTSLVKLPWPLAGFAAAALCLGALAVQATRDAEILGDAR